MTEQNRFGTHYLPNLSRTIGQPENIGGMLGNHGRENRI